MAKYHSPFDDDPFSPKKYARVGALKEMDDYHSHSHQDKEEDTLYRQEKMYGREDKKDDDPFSKDYFRKEEEDLFSKEKQNKKAFGVEEKIEESLKGNYSPKSNDEIAETIFGKGQQLQQISQLEQESMEANGNKNPKDNDRDAGIGSVDEIIRNLPWKRKK